MFRVTYLNTASFALYLIPFAIKNLSRIKDSPLESQRRSVGYIFVIQSFGRTLVGFPMSRYASRKSKNNLLIFQYVFRLFKPH